MSRTNKIAGLLASASNALHATLRDRARRSRSAWCAYLGAYGGIIVCAQEDADTDWRFVCVVDNGRADHVNLDTIERALNRMSLCAPLPASFGFCAVCQLPKNDCDGSNRGQFGEQPCCGGCHGR